MELIPQNEIDFLQRMVDDAHASNEEGSGASVGRVEIASATPEFYKLLMASPEAVEKLLKERVGLIAAAQFCDHPRTLSVCGKTSDRATTTWPDGTDNVNYVPHGLGLGGGDYLDVEVCIDCQRVIGLASAEDILAVQRKERNE